MSHDHTPRARFLEAMGAAWDALAELLTTAHQRPPVRWATARENPLGGARIFLDAGRRGEFDTFKRGRQVVAKWEDVEAYIERTKVKRSRRPASAKTSTTIEPDPNGTAEQREAYMRAELADARAIPMTPELEILVEQMNAYKRAHGIRVPRRMLPRTSSKRR